jgi:hypothetical protein
MNGDILKITGAIIGILAIIAGVYAMMVPMGQRVDFLERQIEVIYEEMATDDEVDREISKATAIVGERITRLEATQSSNAKLLEESRKEGNQRFDERIKALEREQGW